MHLTGTPILLIALLFGYQEPESPDSGQDREFPNSRQDRDSPESRLNRTWESPAPGQSLINSGFENVRVAYDDSVYTVAIENTAYRWDVDAIQEAIAVILPYTVAGERLHLILLEKDLPRVVIAVDCRDGSILTLTEDTRKAWSAVARVPVGRRSAGRTELVAYPQFSFENTLISQLYEVQLNIAPALEVSLWRGMSLSGQVIFPLWNEMGHEGDDIRPGQLVLAQEVKSGRFTGKLSAGNFSASRYGADVSLRVVLPDENWNLKMNLGCTGSSHFLDRQWEHSDLDTWTWSITASWFIPRWNLELEGGTRHL